LLDVVVGHSGGEDWFTSERLGSGDDIRAINEGTLIVTEEGELDHGLAELVHHRSVIESEVLPIAGRGGVMRQVVIGLEAESASDRRRDFTLKVLVTSEIVRYHR
jgi:hypothetical protein